MTTKYGLFSEPRYLSPGVTYRKEGQTQKITETTPPNVKATIARVGKGADATFDKFKPLFEKEQYRSDAKGGAGRAENPWKVPSPMKRGSGLGSFYGTLGGRVEYITQGNQPTAEKSGPPIRSIYTSPAKKGSYGTARTTLSQLHHPLGTGVCGEYAYCAEGVSKPVTTKGSQGEVPFKPTGRPRHGLSDTIGKFPEFLPDGYAVNLHKEHASRSSGDAWKPSSGNKSDCIRSIVRMNA